MLSSRAFLALVAVVRVVVVVFALRAGLARVVSKVSVRPRVATRGRRGRWAGCRIFRWELCGLGHAQIIVVAAAIAIVGAESIAPAGTSTQAAFAST